jgi:hypothetical protein
MSRTDPPIQDSDLCVIVIDVDLHDVAAAEAPSADLWS